MRGDGNADEEDVQQKFIENTNEYVDDGAVNPQPNANILSRLLFHWVTPLIMHGYKTPVQVTDMWQLRREQSAQYVKNVFLKETSKWTGSKRQILQTIHTIYGAPFYLAGVLLVIANVSQVAAPMFLSWIIAFFQDTDEPIWVGLLYVLLIGLTGITTILAAQHHMAILQSINGRVRATLVSLIYDKALRLSNKAKKSKTNGEIVNLMSIDAQKFAELSTYFHMLWTGPLQIVIGSIFLLILIGWPALIGLAVTVIFLPVQAMLMKFYVQWRKACLVQTDNRVKITNEALNGIKIIKMFAWEKSFISKILKIRSFEITKIFKMNMLRIISFALANLTPVVITVTTFATYAAIGNDLTPEIVFPALALFKVLQFPLSQLTAMIGFALEGFVSLNRLQNFFNEEEMVKVVTQDETSEIGITLSNCEFQWSDENEGGKLHDINIRVRKNEFIAIVGKVGSGKSSLLSAFIGEMPKTSGEMTINGSVAYAPQLAWIQNCSLRDNILFGREMNQERYWDCIKRAGLSSDLEILPDGDMTEIGEKGINLSGGQRQRVSLARCIYNEPDILLLDDPLSAVDSHVGKHIFENCIAPSTCTRVLVTHQLQYLKHADRVYVMNQGRIIESGSFNELMNNNSELKRMIGEHMVVSDIEDVKHHQTSVNTEEKTTKPSQLMQDEERASGTTITLPVIKSMISLMGPISVSILPIMYIIIQICSILTDYILSLWTSARYLSIIGFKGYLGIYAGAGLSTMILSVFRDTIMINSGLKMAYKIHELALARIFIAPMSFFDQTPIGRILSRFSKDQETIDTSLIMTMGQFLGGIFSACSTFVLIIIITPWFTLPLVPMLIVYVVFQQLFHKTTREVKRLDSLFRSPLYAHFSESLSGITTIRAFDDEERFKRDNMQKLDVTHKIFHTNIMLQRWVAVRLESMGTVLMTFSALFAVLAREQVEAGLLALALTHSLQVTNMLSWSIRMSVELENNMNNYERLYHYTKNIPTEGLVEDIQVDENWPQEGEIKFQSVVLRYRHDLPAVLRGIDCDIVPGEHIGIVGRTGAGKTSIMMALYRLYELTAGRIQIDGVDLSRIPLHDLRKSISIIPQEPVLFQGTIRSNLDPFDEYSDEEVWNALEKAHIKELVASNRLGTLDLLNVVSEGGENLSVGQRQLLCLARAILKPTKVLVLDEATASVDLETDALIQQTIRSEFARCTMLTIAHRINTIIDSDRILVMDKGEVAEFDTPKRLVQRKDGHFLSMIKGTGEANAKLLIDVAMGTFKASVTELLKAANEAGVDQSTVDQVTE